MNSPRSSDNPEVGKGVNRRTMLLTTAGLLGAGILWNRERILDAVLASSPADELAKAFPTSLPGAGRIDKFRNREAKKVLVHIRQIHETGKDNPETMELILKCQGEIERILAALMEEPEVKLQEVYSEGYGGGMATFQNHLVEMGKVFARMDAAWLQDWKMEREFILQRMKDEQNENRMSPLLKSLELPQEGEHEDLQQSLNELDKKIASLEAKLTAGPRKDLYGAEKIAHEKGLLIRDAESVGLNRNSTAMYETGNVEGLIKNQEKRDDKVLEIASSNPSLCVVTIYGAAHSWIRNIEEWNKLHPEQQYSLIEITPVTLTNSRYGRMRRL